MLCIRVEFMRLRFPDKFTMYHPRPNTLKLLQIYTAVLPDLIAVRNYAEVDIVGLNYTNYLLKFLANLKCDLNTMAVYDYQTWGTWFGWFNE